MEKKLYIVFCLSLDLFFVFPLICFLSFIYFSVSVDGSESKGVTLFPCLPDVLEGNCGLN